MMMVCGAQNNLSQKTKLAPKRVGASAHVVSPRDRQFICICDRRRRPRRAAGGAHAAL